ncbi:MAG: SDR family oxidoreductase [Clostridia bacterium]|nr:SDR family oxidoreductase [Clostridia bacterium]
MRALITGASSGIGRDIAKELARRGYDIVIVARSEDKLNELKNEITNVKVDVIPMDISNLDNCKELYNKVGYVEILVNNAGFGLFGKFNTTDIDREMEMVDLNVKSLHYLTKLFLKDMVEKDKGYILNVASIAGHLPGPFMSTYYATKHYVFNLSESINEELKNDRSHVRVGTLNPGPVETNFNKVANVKFNLSSLTSEYVAKYTVDRMLKGKTDITPGFGVRCTRFFAKVVPDTLMAKIVYNTQKKRG